MLTVQFKKGIRNGPNASEPCLGTLEQGTEARLIRKSSPSVVGVFAGGTHRYCGPHKAAGGNGKDRM